MAEVRTFLTPLEVEPDGNRHIAYWQCRAHPERPAAARIGIVPFGRRNVALASITAETADLNAFVAATGAVEIDPLATRIGLAKLNEIRNFLGLAYTPRLLSVLTSGMATLQALGAVALLSQRIRGAFNNLELEQADYRLFDQLGPLWAPLREIPDLRDRLDAAVALWGNEPIFAGGMSVGTPATIAGGALPASDAFTNTNGTGLATHDSRWTNTAGTWTIQSNQVQVPTTGAEAGCAFNDADFIDNHGAFVTFSSSNNYNMGVSARHATGANTYYTHYGEIVSNVSAVYDVNGTSATELFRGGTCALNDVLGVTIVGSQIRAWKNGTLVTTTTDTTWTTGKAGIAGWANVSGVRGDDFNAFNLPITVNTYTSSSSTSHSHTAGTGVTPKAVIVFVFCPDDSTDRVSGVTYGGVSMTRTSNGFAQDTAGEPCTAYCYVLYSGIGTGTQTVAISGTTSTRRVICISLNSAYTTLETKASGKLEGDSANPSIALDSSTDLAMRFIGIISGHNFSSHAPSDYGIELEESQTAGTHTYYAGYDIRSRSGNISIATTATSDDIAAVAVAIGESSGGPVEQALSGNMPAASGSLSRVVTYLRTLTGSMPAQSGTLTRVATYLRTVTGSLPAQSGTLATIKTRFQALAGDMPSASATLTTIKTKFQALTGSMPSASGSVATVLSRFRTLTGNMPAPTGTLTTLGTFLRTLTGNMPSASGTLNTIRTRFQALAGDMPSASGTISRALIFTRSLAGEMPAATGQVVKSLFSRTLQGSMPAASGTIARLGSFARTLTGNMPSPTATLATVWTTFETLVGNMPAATGTIARELLTIAQSLAGVLPSPSGTLTTLKTHYETVTGNMPAPSAVLSRMYSSFQTLTGNMPSATGAISDAALFAQSLAGTMGAWAGSLATQFSAGTGAMISKYWKKMRRKRAL